MKNNVKLFAIAAVLFMASCGQSETKDENKKDSTENATTTNSNEKATPPTNEGPESKTSTVDAKVNADGSTISVSKDGATVETKTGSAETQVNVSKEGTNITIKK